MADYSQTCFFVTSRKERSFRVKSGDKSRDVPAFVSLTNFILILTLVAPLQSSCGGTGLTGIRISTLSTFIHPDCGACRETFAKYHGIDCRSSLSERNGTDRAHIRLERGWAFVYARYWYICSRLDEISVLPIYRRCQVIRNLKFRQRVAPDTRYKSYIRVIRIRTYALNVFVSTCSSACINNLRNSAFWLNPEEIRKSCTTTWNISRVFVYFEDRKKRKKKIGNTF